MRKTMKMRTLILTVMLAMVMVFSAGCGQKTENGAADQAATTTQANQEAAEAKKITGEINIDGSSTVYPITAAVAEEFVKAYPGVKTSVGYAGTGGGFKKFYANEIPICNASRPIKQEEIDKCKEAGIEYTEFIVAYDGLSIVVNKENTWVNSLTVDQLKAMWEPDSKVKTWKDIDPSWPAEPIKFYSPGTDSGTFEYFTEEITEKKGAIRTDITPSEDDNVLVTGVANDKNAIGYFGFAYYLENADKLKVVPVDGGKGAVEPTVETIKNGTYAPLSRPLFVYVNNKNLAEEHIREFMKYFLTEGVALVGDVGYVPLEDKGYADELAKIK